MKTFFLGLALSISLSVNASSREECKLTNKGEFLYGEAREILDYLESIDTITTAFNCPNNVIKIQHYCKNDEYDGSKVELSLSNEDYNHYVPMYFSSTNEINAGPYSFDGHTLKVKSIHKNRYMGGKTTTALHIKKNNQKKLLKFESKSWWSLT